MEGRGKSADDSEDGFIVDAPGGLGQVTRGMNLSFAEEPSEVLVSDFLKMEGDRALHCKTEVWHEILGQWLLAAIAFKG